MSIETSIAAFLATNVTLAGGHIHALRLPQDPTFPALVYQRISTVRTYSHQGDSNLPECRFQITCWGSTYASVRQLVAQLNSVLGGFSGTMGDVYIGHALLAGDLDIHEVPTMLFQAPIDFMIAFKE